MAACRDEAAGAPAGEPRYPAVMAAFDQVVTATASDADWDAVEALAYGRWDAAARARGERGAAVRRGGGRVFQGPAVFDPAATNTVLAALDAPALLLAGEREAVGGPRWRRPWPLRGSSRRGRPWRSRAAGTSRGWTTGTGSRARCPSSPGGPSSPGERTRPGAPAPAPGSALVADRSVDADRRRVHRAVRAPLVHLDQAGVDQVEAVEERQHFGVGAGGQ